MAGHQRTTHTRNRHTRRSRFAQFKGKIVHDIEARTTDDGCAIGIMFEDRTYLSFDVEVEMGISMLPELSSFKTGEYKPLKRWRCITS